MRETTAIGVDEGEEMSVQEFGDTECVECESYNVGETYCKDCLDKARLETAKQFLDWLVSKERLIGRNWTPRQLELFGVLQREFKEEFLQEKVK